MTLKEVMSNRFLSFYAKSIFSYIYSFKDDHDHCDKTSADICGDLSISVNTLKKYLTELVEHGLIEFKPPRISSKFSSCTYNVNVNCETSEPKKDSKDPKIDESEKKLDETAQKIRDNLSKYTPEQKGKIIEILKYLESN